MYYTLEIRYKGLKSNFAFEEAAEVLQQAENDLTNHLSGLGIRHKHQYSWTDGSTYWYLKSDLEPGNLEVSIKQNIPENLTVFSLTRIPADRDPGKFDLTGDRVVKIKTVEDYFGDHFGL